VNGENDYAEVAAIMRRIRETPCPSCGSLAHHVVDPDDPEGPGEWLRYCDGCGVNFLIGEASGVSRVVRVQVGRGFHFNPDDPEVRT
jgi:hypothetical protein